MLTYLDDKIDVNYLLLTLTVLVHVGNVECTEYQPEVPRIVTSRVVHADHAGSGRQYGLEQTTIENGVNDNRKVADYNLKKTHMQTSVEKKHTPM